MDKVCEFCNTEKDGEDGSCKCGELSPQDRHDRETVRAIFKNYPHLMPDILKKGLNDEK